MAAGWEQERAREWLRRGVGTSAELFAFYGAPVLLALGAWYVVSGLGLVSPRFLPPPERVVARVVEAARTGVLLGHLGLTLRRVVVAFVGALVVSVPVGLAMGFFRTVERLLLPWLVVALSIPGLIWALITLLLFGLSEFTIYTAIAAGLVPMFTVNWWQGVKALDRDLVRARPESVAANADVARRIRLALAEAVAAFRANPVGYLERYGREVFGLDSPAEVQLAARRLAPLYTSRWDAAFLDRQIRQIRLVAGKGDFLPAHVRPEELFWR